MVPSRWISAVLFAVLVPGLVIHSADGKKRKSQREASTTGTPGDYGRKPVSPQDLAVQQAAKYAIQEMQQMCEYCDEGVRDSYRAMSLKEIHSAETKDLTMLEGQMFILNATLHTPVPVYKRSEDTQTIVIFQKQDGSYMGISTERSPFLRH